MKTKMEYYGKDADKYLDLWNNTSFCINNNLSSFIDVSIKPSSQVVVLHVYGNVAQQLHQIKETKLKIPRNVLFIILGEEKYLKEYLKYGADEAFDENSSIDKITKRIMFMINHPFNLNSFVFETQTLEFKIPLWKRVFDIVFSSFMIILLLPVFTIIALLIKLESRGPVFYAAKRVGAGYKVFDFYKFRSMYKNADSRIKDLAANNQYEVIKTLQNQKEAELTSSYSATVLYHDEGVVFEKEHLENKKEEQEKAFFKLVNDPRITKVGRFIRNTSIDELPQLFNVLKGDMSVVGNRPLPLYEAEKLTSDRWVKRFIAPAGLTGLWQVTKRGKSSSMSPDERKMLDIQYAEHYGFWSDLWIIIRTIPAMLQHENV